MLKDLKKQVSEELGLPYEVVHKAYDSFWLFIRNTIVVLPLKEDLTDEEFNELRTNFNIPSLGKLHCTLGRYRAIKNNYEKRNKANKDKTNVHSIDNNNG